MKAIVTKIDQPKISRFEKTYQRIYFKTEDRKWCQTDAVNGYKNYARWKKVIDSGVGTIIDNLKFKTDSKIDADSQIIILGKYQQTKDTKPTQQTLI